jgi:hypothetical protein
LGKTPDSSPDGSIQILIYAGAPAAESRKAAVKN